MEDKNKRYNLEPHIDKYVLGSGWLEGWKDFPHLSTNGIRRVYVAQPTIKTPNKDVLYKDLDVISTEHHINLFIKFEDLGNYDTEGFQLKNKINFTGTVERYTRYNGTEDFGIYANNQSTLPFRINRLFLSVKESSQSIKDYINRKRVHPEQDDIDFLNKFALREIVLLYDELEKTGNYLPTFNMTFDDLLGVLRGTMKGIESLLEDLELYRELMREVKNAKSKRSKKHRIFRINKEETKNQLRRGLGF